MRRKVHEPFSYARLDDDDLPDIGEFGAVEVLVELDGTGEAVRLVGISASGETAFHCPPYAAAPFDFHGALLDCVGETISRESFETRWREAEARNAGDRLRILRGLRATPSYRREVEPRQLWAAVGWLALLVLVVLWTVVF